MAKTNRLVAYLRVSTARQGRSRLGLEAQQAALSQFAKETGATIVGTYQEIETGKHSNRPELAKAIAHAKRSGATLAVAKLDRLARNAGFLLTLQASGLPMAFLDLPGANEFTVGVMALVAQHEAKMISERTRAALQAYKRRGGLLGGARPECRNLTQAGRKRGARAAGEAVARKADEAYSDLLPSVREWRDDGCTLAEIADRLNEAGHTTRRGCPWNAVQVSRVLTRV